MLRLARAWRVLGAPRCRALRLWDRGALVADRDRHSVLGLNVHSFIRSCADTGRSLHTADHHTCTGLL